MKKEKEKTVINLVLLSMPTKIQIDISPQCITPAAPTSA